jgi:flagellar basal-body rod modification protein FlgD
MSITSINNSTTSGASGASGTGKTNTDNSNLTMDDFFQLMVAQLKNQDMYNTTDNTEFIAQMAQFSMVQALADLSELSMTSYGVSLIGKEATIAKVADDGTVKSIKGIVDSVNFYNGSTQVVVDGKSYALSSVMSVKEPDIIIPNSTVTTNNTDSTSNSTNTTSDSTDTTTDAANNTDSSGSNPDGSSI